MDSRMTEMQLDDADLATASALITSESLSILQMQQLRSAYLDLQREFQGRVADLEGELQHYKDRSLGLESTVLALRNRLDVEINFESFKTHLAYSCSTNSGNPFVVGI